MEKIETEIIEEGFKLKKPTSSSLSFGVPCKGTSVAHWGEVFFEPGFGNSIWLHWRRTLVH